MSFSPRNPGILNQTPASAAGESLTLGAGWHGL